MGRAVGFTLSMACWLVIGCYWAERFLERNYFGLGRVAHDVASKG